MTDTQDDIESAPTATSEDLERAAGMARRVLALRVEIEERQAELSSLENTLLPDLMHTVGLESFSLADGSTVKLSTIIRASLARDMPPARRAEGFAWLVANGHGDLIKHKIEAQFGRSDGQSAERAYQLLRAEFPAAKITDEESVHSGTLTALVRETIGSGADVPFEALGVSVRRGAEVKPPRAKAKRGKNDEEEF